MVKVPSACKMLATHAKPHIPLAKLLLQKPSRLGCCKHDLIACQCTAAQVSELG